MKSTLFVALSALAISGSFAVLLKGSCPKPEKPKGDNWAFSNVSLLSLQSLLLLILSN